MDATFWLVAVLGLLWFLSNLSSLSNRGTITRLERKIDLILKHLNIDPDRDVNPQIAELLKAGQKIQAMKLYRLHSGAGLKEAKDYIESL